MLLIKYIHDLVNFATGKGLTEYHASEDIDNEIYAVEMDIYRSYLDEYARTSKMSSFLSPFETFEELDVTDGVTTKPEDMQVETYAHAQDGSLIDIVDSAAWSNRLKDPVSTVEKQPILKIYGNRVDVRPQTITKITLGYLRLPKRPKYAYTVSGGRRQYIEYTEETKPDGWANPVSVDVEFGAILHDQIVNQVLEKMGINMKDNQIVQYAEMLQRGESR